MSGIIRSYAGVCETGYNPSNPDKPCQDSIAMVEHHDSGGLLLAVFDGHGEDGHHVSQYFKTHLPAAVFGHPAFSRAPPEPVADNIGPPPEDSVLAALARDAASATPEVIAAASPAAKSSSKPAVGVPRRRQRDVGLALKEALLSVEKQVLSLRGVNCSLSGSTGCVAVVLGDEVTIANVGDSRAVLYRCSPRRTRREGQRGAGGGGETAGVSEREEEEAEEGEEEGEEEGLLRVRPLLPVTLTVDHKPTLAAETRRILLAGGRVHAIKYDDGIEGPVRVWLRHEDIPGLAMSRSLCDTVGKRAGVISTPDIYRYTLEPRADSFLVLASDGLWEFLTGRQVGAMVASTRLQAEQARAAYMAALEARAEAAESGAEPGSWPALPEGGGEDGEPTSHLALALDALAEAAGTAWHAREGVIDDISIILAEVGSMPRAEAGDA